MSINVTGNLKYTLKVLYSYLLKEMLSLSSCVRLKRQYLGHGNEKSGTALLKHISK